MNGVKPWYKSATVIAAIVTLIAVIAGGFGFEVSDEEQAVAVEQTTTIVAAIGAIIALIGRIRARKQIGKPDGGDQWTPLLLAVLLPLSLLAGGCVSTPEALNADYQRRTALEPVVEFYVAHHPEQAQTWADFMRAWERSWLARGGKVPADE